MIDKNIEALKSTFAELKINLQNSTISTKIQNNIPNFNYINLQNAIKKYLDNFAVIENSTEDIIIQQIQSKALELLKFTNNENIELYVTQFENLALWLIDKTPEASNIEIKTTQHKKGLEAEKLFINYLVNVKKYSMSQLKQHIRIGDYESDIQILNNNNDTLAYIEIKSSIFARLDVTKNLKNIVSKIQTNELNFRLFLVIFNDSKKVYYEWDYLDDFYVGTIKQLDDFPNYEELKRTVVPQIVQNNTWDSFIKTVNFEKLQSIKRGVANEYSKEGERVRVFLKSYLLSLKNKIFELNGKNFKIQLNQASTQVYYTQENGFRGGFYYGSNYEKATQLNITFWALWGGGVFIKDNEGLFFNNKDFLEKAQIHFKDLEFDEGEKHIFALSFNPPSLPNENQVIKAVKRLIELYKFFEIIDMEQLNSEKEIVPENNIIFSGNMQIEQKSSIKASFGVENISTILSNIIVTQPSDSGMMIGIFGKWGRGKTYLANRTWAHIKANNKDFENVEFSAWKYQDVKSSWAYLYEMFLDKYLEKDKWYIKAWKLFLINKTKYGLSSIVFFTIYIILSFIWVFCIDKLSLAVNLLSVASLILLLKSFLFYLQHRHSAIGLFKKYFSKTNFKDVLGLQSEIQNELRFLLKTWIPNSDTKKIVLFVDDLDRCETKQMIGVLDGLRIILDDKEIYSRLVIVTSIDEEILSKAFLNNNNILNDNSEDRKYFKEYLEKVFLVGIRLNSLSVDESREFLRNITDNKVKLSTNKKLTNQEIKSISEDDQISESSASETVVIEPDSSSGFEISEKELKEMLSSIEKLDKPTPRKIRIFYYKYLIAKRMLNDKPIDTGSSSLFDLLIAYSNNAQHKEELIKDDELLKIVKMVTVL
ncbi:MAG: P-loop NTPase fold protein [Campylobacterales bacterium]|nr:P-loop NTPase fold protein [Campylobacterales bacterium]